MNADGRRHPNVENFESGTGLRGGLPPEFRLRLPDGCRRPRYPGRGCPAAAGRPDDTPPIPLSLDGQDIGEHHGIRRVHEGSRGEPGRNRQGQAPVPGGDEEDHRRGLSGLRHGLLPADPRGRLDLPEEARRPQVAARGLRRAGRCSRSAASSASSASRRCRSAPSASSASTSTRGSCPRPTRSPSTTRPCAAGRATAPGSAPIRSRSARPSPRTPTSSSPTPSSTGSSSMAARSRCARCSLWLRDNVNYALYFEGCVTADETIMKQHKVDLKTYNEKLFLDELAAVFSKVDFVGHCSYNPQRIVVARLQVTSRPATEVSAGRRGRTPALRSGRACLPVIVEDEENNCEGLHREGAAGPGKGMGVRPLEARRAPEIRVLVEGAVIAEDVARADRPDVAQGDGRRVGDLRVQHGVQPRGRPRCRRAAEGRRPGEYGRKVGGYGPGAGAAASATTRTSTG